MLRPYSYTENRFKVDFGNIQYFTSPQADWLESDEGAPGYIKNKPEIIAGTNIEVTKEDNKIIISATDGEPERPNPPLVYTIIDYIIDNKISCWAGEEGNIQERVFLSFNKEGSYYEDQGLYYTYENNEYTSAGYQVTIYPASEEDIAQYILILNNAQIKNTYQYAEMFGNYLEMGNDGTYWYADGEITKNVNGKDYIYTIYRYNKELIGAPVESQEYWRLELEVTPWQE